MSPTLIFFRPHFFQTFISLEASIWAILSSDRLLVWQDVMKTKYNRKWAPKPEVSIFETRESFQAEEKLVRIISYNEKSY